MDENDHERLFNFTLGHKLEKQEKRFYCCCTFHSHSRPINNEHSSYPTI